MKQKRYWLRMGISGLVVGILFILWMNYSGFTCVDSIGASCRPTWDTFLSNFWWNFNPQVLPKVIIIMAVFTLIGAVLGLIYGLIKKKTRMISQ